MRPNSREHQKLILPTLKIFETRKELRNLMIKVYSKQGCPQCDMTKRLLDQKGIPFTEYRVDLDEKILEEIKAKGVSSLPYVETPVHKWTGFRPDIIQKIQESEWN